MKTTADLSDRFVFQVPAHLPNVVIRVPLPAADAIGSGSIGEAEAISSVDVQSSLAPVAMRDERDRMGNLYRVLVYHDPQPGELIVTAKLRHVTLRSDLDHALPDVRLPLSNVSADKAVYLRPSRLVQSDDPAIQAMAAQLLQSSPTEADVAQRIVLMLQKNISYTANYPGQRTDALATLADRAGCCEGWSHLFLALARACGIPARYVGGYSIGGTVTYPLTADGDQAMHVSSASLPHAWVEIWYPGVGWVPYEPQSTAGFVDTHHVPVWSGPDGESNLPLLTWNASRNASSRCSYNEKELASNVSDAFSVEYAGASGDCNYGGPILFTR